MDRLEVLSSVLVEKLGLAPMAKQWAACLAACELAVAESKIDDLLARNALRQLRAGHDLTSEQKAQIDARAGRLDDEYFDLQEAVDKGEAKTIDCLHAFAQARAWAALSFASGGLPDALREAIYEAAIAVGDHKRQFFAVVEAALA